MGYTKTQLVERIRTISRNSSYLVAGHDGNADNAASNREEELIAMAMRRQGSLGFLGKLTETFDSSTIDRMYEAMLVSARKK